jgi:hypothetical protein
LKLRLGNQITSFERASFRWCGNFLFADNWFKKSLALLMKKISIKTAVIIGFLVMFTMMPEFRSAASIIGE